MKTVQTRERLLDESVLLLHRAETDLAPDQRRILEQLRETDLTLVGKKVLVVDDDVRNIFALTSLLEDHNLKVVHAENGRAGIELLKKKPDVDLVLMDIMMPEMDGYETMKAIREVPEFRSLPIIALTAKAMKGDRPSASKPEPRTTLPSRWTWKSFSRCCGFGSAGGMRKQRRPARSKMEQNFEPEINGNERRTPCRR